MKLLGCYWGSHGSTPPWLDLAQAFPMSPHPKRKSEPLPLVDLFYILIQKGSMVGQEDLSSTMQVGSPQPPGHQPSVSGTAWGSRIKRRPWWLTVFSTEEAGTQPRKLVLRPCLITELQPKKGSQDGSLFQAPAPRCPALGTALWSLWPGWGPC